MHQTDGYTWRSAKACQADFHILVTPHGGVLIKIIYVKSDEAGTGGGFCTVQDAFGCHEAGAVSGGITREVQPVAADGDADVMCVLSCGVGCWKRFASR